MTDEKRIEEIRARHAAYLGGDRHAYSRADVYAPDDVGELLAALDAERARAVRAEAAMSDVADFLAWEENKWIATGDSVPDAVRKVVLGLRAERDARLAISPNDCGLLAEIFVDYISQWGDPDGDLAPIRKALRAHAAKALRAHAAKAGGGT